MLRSICGSSGVLAFADDVALIVQEVSLRSRMATTFELFGRAWAMRLPAVKCVLIPLDTDDATDDERSRRYRQLPVPPALLEAAPHWRSMKIAGAATYLRAVIGPDADSGAQGEDVDLCDVPHGAVSRRPAT